MKAVTVTDEAIFKGGYDVLVAGGGVDGAAVSVSAERRGKKVILIKKEPL